MLLVVEFSKAMESKPGVGLCGTGAITQRAAPPYRWFILTSKSFVSLLAAEGAKQNKNSKIWRIKLTDFPMPVRMPKWVKYNPVTRSLWRACLYKETSWEGLGPRCRPSVNCLFNHPGWRCIMKIQMCLFPFHIKGKPPWPLVTILLYLFFALERCLTVLMAKEELWCLKKWHSENKGSLCLFCELKLGGGGNGHTHVKVSIRPNGSLDIFDCGELNVTGSAPNYLT